jgi:hypothetical protein
MRRFPILLALVAAGCSRPTPRAAPAGPSFRTDVAPVLDRMCARAEGCHGDKPTDSVSLDLRTARAYGQLVGVPAEARRGALRVKPGDPAASFLLDKLSGKLGHGEGKPMPIDPQTGAPISPSPIDSSYLEAILKPWIAAGAPNN